MRTQDDNARLNDRLSRLDEPILLIKYQCMTDLVSPERRKPGRKPGCEKIPGSGRKPGGKNKVSADFRSIVLTRGKPLEVLCDISRGVKIRVGPQAGPGQPAYVYPTMQERAAAAKILADKIFPAGLPELAGKDGAPLNPAPEYTNTERARKLLFLISRSLHDQGYSLSRDGKVYPTQPIKTQPTADRHAEIEAARAVMATPAPDEPEEKTGRPWPTEAERYDATRREEQGFADHNQFNVVRIKPRA